MAKILQLILTPIAKIQFKGKKPWIVSERGYDARDNGYYMFLYLRDKHPEIDAWYLISRDSADLNKVANKGNIVFYGSLKYWLVYISASVLIGAFNPIIPSGNKKFGLEIKKKHHQKVFFIQHGIIGNDVPCYHREETWFDLFFCGAQPEFEYVSENFNYRNGEVRYTGLARFDSLQNVKHKRTIVIMPTWRVWLSKLDEEEMAKSDYFIKWNSFINNPALEYLSEHYDVNVVFYLHELMQKYVGLFSSSNKSVIIGNNHEYDVERLIKDGALLITDYSSVHFDFAYMNKPVIYYQFDSDNFFKNHLGAGWFDYCSSGFGECVQTEEELIKCANYYVMNEFKLKPEYEQRIEGVFPLHDDHNCERIYQEIIHTFDHDELF
jgi:CDP-glycerol glycerophosphotransferase (TagB/SpsB family)